MDDDTKAQAATALVEFGYTLEPDGSFVKYKADRPREKWEPAEGSYDVAIDGTSPVEYETVPVSGFRRFTRDDGKWAPVAYTVSARWSKVAGLTVEEHPECFDYIYPADYVLNVYATAVAARE